MPPVKQGMNRFSEAQREYITLQIRRLLVMGYQGPEIRQTLMKRLGIEMSYALTDYYIKRARRDVVSREVDTIAARNMEIEVLLETRRQAYEALERSKQDFESKLREVTTRTVGEYEERRERESLRTEHRNADAKYMAIILDTSAQLRALLGLDAAQKLDHTISPKAPGEEILAPINFDALYEPVAITDPAEERIRQIEAGPQLILEVPANGVHRTEEG